jgi:hypothetical protein
MHIHTHLELAAQPKKVEEVAHTMRGGRHAFAWVCTRTQTHTTHTASWTRAQNKVAHAPRRGVSGRGVLARAFSEPCVF